jgi:hypothetical protein
VDADANWLLSTTVQSAAAFVAIVGGLLVSRLVALTTERSGLRARHAEATRLTRVAEERVAEAEQTLCDLEAYRAIDAESDAIMAAHGAIDAATVAHESGWGDGDPKVVEQIETFLSDIREAFTAVQRALNGRDPSAVEPADIEQDVEVILQPWISDVLGRLADEARPTERYKFGSITSLLPPRDPALIAADRQSREREYERVTEDVAVARRHRDDRAMERQLAEEALALLGRPEGIGWGFVTLAYMALTGIVLPLAVMLRGRTDTGFPLRAAVVVAFVSGLVVFGFYLRYVVRLALR